MPKSKVRKKVATSTASRAAHANSESQVAARAQIAAPTGPVYLSIMLGLMVLGLIWLLCYYLLQDVQPFEALGQWNFTVGFALIISGLLMTMRWR